MAALLRTNFVLDALEQAVDDRRGAGALIHHSNRPRSVSMRYTDRLADVVIAPSVGSRGGSYASASAESVIGLDNSQVINAEADGCISKAVEFATLEWVDWFNNRRLLKPIVYVPLPEFEARYYHQAAVA